MRMLKPILATAALALFAASCTPPADVPPPRFTPRPPLPPVPVDPYAQAPDPYGNPPPSTAPQNPPPQPEPTRPGEYPTATRTANPNEVISPYEPYNVIDVEGFRSGQLARDPSNNRIFRVP
jgi:hypothetical protein